MISSFRRTGLPVAVVGLALLAAFAARKLAWAGPHNATPLHLRLVKSEPAKHDTLSAAPTSIKLWFSQKPELAVTTVKLTASDGREIAVGAARLEEDPKRLVVADVTGAVTAGALTILWKTSSGDGHILRGEIPFVLRTTASSDGH